MDRTIRLASLVLFALVAAVLASGCGDRGDDEVAGLPQPASPSSVPAGSVSQTEVLGGLTVELIVPPFVRSGGSLQTTMRVENKSEQPVTDPGCQLGAARFGLLPVEDPDGGLWQGYTVDCGGPFTYEPGASEEYTGFAFRATDAYGTPLTPGDYLAAWEVDGKRLLYSVTVES